MSEPWALESRDIRKSFGSFTALAGVTLRVARGDFLTLFGANGAGKTTLLKIAASLMAPTSGQLFVEGVDIREEPEQARRHIGFLSHNTYIYRDLSPLENLRFFARLYSVPDPLPRIRELLDRVGLSRRANDPVRAFSRGQQQRVGLARAILHDPSLILLDEPYTGLDVSAAETLDGILADAVERRKTVILTSHDVERGLRPASRAAIVDRGRLVFDGRPDDTARAAYVEFVAGGAA
ncbi:MAG TPA: heme ABC exporter ATP-binding protein CcmA [Terriglobia bacterium]|nr:heme ABC exporter ATP-binding protein CcmA [Terriglobia bacterium]